jgi:hypothetical protein
VATLNLGSFDTGLVPLAEVIDNFCAAYGYTDTIVNGGGATVANPETKAQFMKRKIREHIQVVANGYRKSSASRAAETSVTEITLT